MGGTSAPTLRSAVDIPPARPSKPSRSRYSRTRRALAARGDEKRGRARLSMRGRRLAGRLYGPPRPRPAPLLCEPRREVVYALFSPPCGSRAPGAFGVCCPCVMTHTLAKTWGRRRALESVSFRVWLAPLASLLLTGVARRFPGSWRGAGRGCGPPPVAASPGPGGGPGWRRASAPWAPKSKRREGASRGPSAESTGGPVVRTRSDPGTPSWTRSEGGLGSGGG